MFSLTLPDNATPVQLQAAAQFFQTLAASAASQFPGWMDGGGHCDGLPQRDPDAGPPPPPFVSAGRPQEAAPVPPAPAPVSAVPLPPVPPVPALSSAAVDPSPTVPEASAVFGTAATVPPVPAPLPAPPADAPPVNAAPLSPAGVEVDADGLPHDPRIHAGTKGKNKDGRWTAKRGLNDAAFVARVQADLRALMAAPVPPSMPALPPLPAPSADAATPAPAEAPAGPHNFATLMVAVGPHLQSGRVTQQMLGDACRSVGVQSLPLLSARPDLVPACWAYIREQAKL